MEPYDTPASDLEGPAPTIEIRQCGLGITSFVLSILNFVLMFIMVGIAGYLQATTPGGLNEKSPQAILIGLFIILVFVLAVVSIILGVVSMFRKNRNKLFGALGLVFNLVTILIVGGLMALGLAMRT